MEFDAADTKKVLERKLSYIRDKEYLPADIINLLESIAQEQYDAQVKANVQLPNEFPEDRELMHGRALVEREHFPFDLEQASELLARFIGLAKESGGALGEGATMVAKALGNDEFAPADLFLRVLADDADFFNEWAEKTPEAPQTLYFLAYAAMTPSLAAAAEKLSEKLPEVSSWNTGNCPICGGLPLISSLKEKEGFRYDTCSFCRHEFRVRRMACSVCGEDDQKQLTFFTVDQEPGYRVDVCASCKSYIKTIDFRQMDRKILPQFDDLDSLALDFVAREQGYIRPTLSAWGF